MVVNHDVCAENKPGSPARPTSVLNHRAVSPPSLTGFMTREGVEEQGAPVTAEKGYMLVLAGDFLLPLYSVIASNLLLGAHRQVFSQFVNSLLYITKEKPNHTLSKPIRYFSS